MTNINAHNTVEQSQSEFYREYYRKKGANRNDIKSNPEVLFQVLAAERGIILAARKLDIDIQSAKILDVGCGAGADLYHLLRLGAVPMNISGIDIQQERLSAAKRIYPDANLSHGDASAMQFPDSAFDLVFESTMFSTLADDSLCRRIASEMIRVCRPGGYVLLLDWSFPRRASADYKALGGGRVADLFEVGRLTELVSVVPGAIVPPIGRFLSARFPALYFLAAAILPFLVGQRVYLLKKS